MSDESLRNLERTHLATGDPGDRARLVAGLARAGQPNPFEALANVLHVLHEGAAPFTPERMLIVDSVSDSPTVRLTPPAARLGFGRGHLPAPHPPLTTVGAANRMRLEIARWWGQFATRHVSPIRVESDHVLRVRWRGTCPGPTRVPQSPATGSAP